MANGKSDRKKPVSILATIITIIIILITSMFGINIEDIIPNDTTNAIPQQTTQSVQDVEGQLTVHMIDVGQADCFLLVQDGKTAMVDCGTRSTSKDAVKYLNELGITKIDYLIGTHPHEDHMGGMYNILVNFDIGTVVIPNAQSTTNWYIKLINELNTGNYNVEYAEKGDIYNIENATMKVISAETDVGENTNNYSIVLKVTFGQMDMIMTGDAETDIEEKILESGDDIDAEILKVGHHGSETSSSEKFLDAVSPEYGLISCKVGNQHEHPNKEIMERLEKRGVEVYRTDECGSVVMTVTTDSVSFNCEPGDYLSGIELEKREK